MNGIELSISESSLDRAQKLLAGIRGGVYQAVGSALKRAGDAGKTVSKAAVADEYTISQSQFLRQTKQVNHFVQHGGMISVEFGYSGYVIPLMNFRTSVGSDGRVVTQVKRNSVAEMLDNAFRAQMGGHVGIYERIGLDRFPVKELYGPAAPSMMYSNKKVMDKVEEKVVETYEKRLDHEIMRVLNGWGK